MNNDIFRRKNELEKLKEDKTKKLLEIGTFRTMNCQYCDKPILESDHVRSAFGGNHLFYRSHTKCYEEYIDLKGDHEDIITYLLMWCEYHLKQDYLDLGLKYATDIHEKVIKLQNMFIQFKQKTERKDLQKINEFMNDLLSAIKDMNNDTQLMRPLCMIQKLLRDTK